MQHSLLYKYSSKLFLFSFGLTISLIIPFIIIITSIIVDPFGYFNLLNIQGFNSIKPRITHEVRFTKAHQIYRQQPTNIILGSSRAEIAFDPESPSLDKTNLNGKTYNSSMAGLGINEMYKTLKHAYYTSKNLKLVIINLDFIMFNAHRESNIFNTEVLDFNENRLVLTSKDSYLKTFLYDINNLLGIKAFKESLNTINDNKQLFNKDRNQNYLYLVNGFRDQFYNPLFTVTWKHGHRNNFNGQEPYFMKKIWRAGPNKRFCFFYKNINTLEIFRNIVEFGYNKKLNIKFIIGPIHARMLLGIKETGLWVQFEDWKREMVRIINETSSKYNLTPFPLWDFSGFNSITTEPIPPLTSRANMRWYWEGSHYKKSVGDIMLDKILDSKAISNKDLEKKLNLEKKRQNDLLKYVNFYTKSITKNYYEPDFLHYIRGLLYLELKEYQKAIKDFENAIKITLNKEHKIVLKSLIQEAQQARNTRKNFTDFGIQLNPNMLEKHLNNTRIKMSLYEKKFPEEVKFIQTVAKDILKLGQGSNCGHDMEQLVIGNNAIKINNISLAKSCFANAKKIYYKEKQRAEKINVPFKELKFTSSFNLAKNGLLEIEPIPNNWIEFQERGQKRTASGNFSGAIEDYSYAINEYPAHASLYYLRGITYLELNDKYNALNDFKNGIKLDATNKNLIFLINQIERELKYS